MYQRYFINDIVFKGFAYIHENATVVHLLKYLNCFVNGGVAQWDARLTRNMEIVGRAPSNAPVVSLSKKLYPYCIVLVGSRNGLAPSLNIVNTIKSCKRFKLTRENACATSNNDE